MLIEKTPFESAPKPKSADQLTGLFRFRSEGFGNGINQGLTTADSVLHDMYSIFTSSSIFFLSGEYLMRHKRIYQPQKVKSNRKG
ncbi:hypothetical protein AVEN_239729-1 [Araneus ventricosus]|uniref:Uncharacterized protein n=1 Tax=Araneus ventricosus TaxID=182803 RepID=A0A4Y1ZNF6_ARAVE|nr:hypothetical protein AVEN_239729-1 [Araneus ventricosus]